MGMWRIMGAAAAAGDVRYVRTAVEAIALLDVSFILSALNQTMVPVLLPVVIGR